ncbi:hypothetical protein, partial [Alpinimonas psychrophila]
MNITTKNRKTTPVPERGSAFTARASSDHSAAAHHRTPLFIHIAAWSVPVLLLGQFALVAVLPVAAIVIGSFASPRARALRWRAGLLAAVYAAPLALWIIRPDGAQSLSKDISPVSVGLIVAASAV